MKDILLLVACTTVASLAVTVWSVVIVNFLLTTIARHAMKYTLRVEDQSPGRRVYWIGRNR